MPVRQAWVFCGVILVGVGAFLTDDPGGRLRALTTVTLHWWPMVVLGLAILNTLIAVLPEGTWIAPVALGLTGGCGLLFRSSEMLHSTQRLLPGAVICAGGVAVACGMAGQSGGSRTAVLISRHTEINGRVGPTIVTRALLAELRVDLTEATWDDIATLRVNVIVGRVKLRIPPTTPLVLVDGGTAVALRESGARDPSGTDVILKVGGAFGRIDVVRG